MRQRDADHVAVAYEADGFFPVPLAELVHEGDDAELCFEQQLAVGDAGGAMQQVEFAPTRQPVELVVALAGPVAEIDLVELGRELERQS